MGLRSDLVPFAIRGLNNQQIDVRVSVPVASGAGTENDDVVGMNLLQQSLRQADGAGIRVIGRQRVEAGIQFRRTVRQHSGTRAWHPGGWASIAQILGQGSGRARFRAGRLFAA